MMSTNPKMLFKSQTPFLAH